MEVELDLSNYAIKADLKNVTGKSKFTKKADLASVKYDVDMLDIDKLEKVPTGLNSSKSKVDKLLMFILFNLLGSVGVCYSRKLLGSYLLLGFLKHNLFAI